MKYKGRKHSSTYFPAIVNVDHYQNRKTTLAGHRGAIAQLFNIGASDRSSNVRRLDAMHCFLAFIKPVQMSAE